MDSVGGRFAIRDEEDVALTSSSPISNLGDLSIALKGATSAPRFFRSVQQWTAAYWRWAVAAISAEHWQIAHAVTSPPGCYLAARRAGQVEVQTALCCLSL